jgi:large subunit ribosomal protein L35
MKTHRGAAKRFRKTASGLIKRAKAYTSHLLGGKSQKRKRKLRKSGLVSEAEQKRISKLIPYK